MSLKEAHINDEEQVEQKLWKELPGTEGQERAMLLVELAKQAIYRSEGTEALALAEEAREVYRSIGALASTVEVSNAIQVIGYAYKELNREEEAIAALDESMKILREGGYPFLTDTLRNKAMFCFEAGRYQEAMQTFLEAVQINEINGDSEFVGKDLYWVALCLQKLGNWSEALVHALRARDCLKEKAEARVENIAWCDLVISESYLEMRSFELAKNFAQRAYDIGIFRKHAAILCKGALLVGKIHIFASEYKEAEERFEEARNLVAGNDDWEMVRNIEKEMINLFLMQDRVDEAAEIERRLKSLDEVIG